MFDNDLAEQYRVKQLDQHNIGFILLLIKND